jgi:hypothetical protein
VARPQPLPPAERTVGQLVAETLRLYGDKPLAALVLGVPAAVVDTALSNVTRTTALWLAPLAGALLLTLSYVGAVLIASGVRPERRFLVTAYVAGALVFVPFPFLSTAFILPGLAWLAFIGLAVPAAALERLELRDAFRRGVQLARADYVHALGSLATLAIVVFLTRTMLAVMLRGFGDATIVAATFLADVVITPVLFLGAALLYFDQEARVGESRRAKRVRRRSGADLHPADDADRAGRPDAEVQP